MSNPETRAANMVRDPHPKAPGALVGIDEPMIRLLVHSFYARVRADPLLGPVFNRDILDWDAHLDKLCAFWSSVTLMTGRYKGTPMNAHAELPEITPAHFERWLALFQDHGDQDVPTGCGRGVRRPRQPYCGFATARHCAPPWRKHRTADRETSAGNCRQRGPKDPEARAWRVKVHGLQSSLHGASLPTHAHRQGFAM